MSAPKRRSSGRTTPKGTVAPGKKATKKRTGASAPAAGRDAPGNSKFDKTGGYVSRPTSHNRGNR
jgi:hypothetical protein